MSKYEPLWKSLAIKTEDSFFVSFDEVKEVCGFEINHSFLLYKKESIAYGIEVGKISLKDKKIAIKKVKEDN